MAWACAPATMGGIPSIGVQRAGSLCHSSRHQSVKLSCKVRLALSEGVRRSSAMVSSNLLPSTLPLAGSYQPLARALSRSEEHTSELQSRPHLVCRLLLEKKK